MWMFEFQSNVSIHSTRIIHAFYNDCKIIYTVKMLKSKTFMTFSFLKLTLYKSSFQNMEKKLGFRILEKIS